MRKMALVALVLWGICSALALPASAAVHVKTGVLGPMAFTQGEGHWDGASLVAEEINPAGGVMVGGEKRNIELVKIDTNELLSIPDATSATETAASRHKVGFLVSGFFAGIAGGLYAHFMRLAVPSPWRFRSPSRSSPGRSSAAWPPSTARPWACSS